MITLGLDVGLAHCGWSIWDGVELLGLGVITTKRDDSATASADLLRRAGELYSGLHAIELPRKAPAPNRIVMEAVSWPRSSSVVGKMGVAYGVVACFTKYRPVVHVSPQAVRKALELPKGKVDKDDMLGVVRDARGCGQLHELLDALPRVSEWEHAVDACAVVLAERTAA